MKCKGNVLIFDFKYRRKTHVKKPFPNKPTKSNEVNLLPGRLTRNTCFQSKTLDNILYLNKKLHSYKIPLCFFGEFCTVNFSFNIPQVNRESISASCSNITDLSTFIGTTFRTLSQMSLLTHSCYDYREKIFCRVFSLYTRFEKQRRLLYENQKVWKG